jgi:hypothetical protein
VRTGLRPVNRKSRPITEPAHHLPEPPELSLRGAAGAAPRVKELKECDLSYDVKLLQRPETNNTILW